MATQLSLNEIPKFQFQLKNEQLSNCLKQLAFNLKNQEKSFAKLRKDIDGKITESQMIEILVYVNSLIDIDPALSKQLKIKEAKDKNGGVSANGHMNLSASDLGKKINQISESVLVLSNGLKSMEKKMSEIEYHSKSMLTQKSNGLQQQIDDNYSKINNQILQIKQKLEVSNLSVGDKIREIQTKTIWQINDCKLRLNSCISEQYVKDSMRELEGKLNSRMKEELIKQGSIDPQRIAKNESQVLKNQKEFANQITEIKYKIQGIKDNIEKAVLTKKEYGDEKIQLEKRFSLLNGNLTDSVRRIRQSQTQITDEKVKMRKMHQFQQTAEKQIGRMNEVLKNLKIGDDFQKMLQKMDPHKICELDDRVNSLNLGQQKLYKNLDLTKIEVDRLRSKTEFCNILTPGTSNTSTSKISKEEVQEWIHEYMANNLITKKILNIESQIMEIKTFPEMVNEINKKMARLQKQSDNHNLNYELKGLQQYTKKEILLVNNRINNLELMMNEDRKRRPVSAAKTTITDQRLGSSVSYKKLIPVNCISCYSNTVGSNLDKRSVTRKL